MPKIDPTGSRDARRQQIILATYIIIVVVIIKLFMR